MVPTRNVNKVTDPRYGPFRDRLALHPLASGVSLLTTTNNFLIMSSADSEEDVTETTARFGGALETMLAEGSFPDALLEK